MEPLVARLTVQRPAGGVIVVFAAWDGSGRFETKIEGANPASFRVIQDHLYALDSQSVYYKKEKIEGADPRTFEVINDSYAKDARGVYLVGEIIPGADPKTFENIDSFWSRDKDDIYVSTWAIEACHLASFEVILESWATDSECAYSGFNKVNGADVTTFKALYGQYAKDKRHVYASFYQVIEKDDISSMPVAVQRYVENENLQRNYLVRQIVDADPESFMVFQKRYCGAIARDKHRCYSGGKAASCNCEQTR